MADYARGDYSGKRGTQVITDSLTFTGTGGVDVSNGGDIKSGTTSMMNSTGLVTENVDGMVVALPFILTIDATSATGTKMKFAGSTNTYAVPYKSGSVVGLGVSAHTAFGASRHATFTVYNGTTTTGFAANLTATDQVTKVSQNKDTDAFSAGAKLNVLCEHASMTTYTCAAVVYIEV